MDHTSERHANRRGTCFDESRQFGGRLVVCRGVEKRVTGHMRAVGPLRRGRENGRRDGEQQRGRAMRRLVSEGPEKIEGENVGMLFAFLVVAAISSIPKDLRIQPMAQVTERATRQR